MKLRIAALKKGDLDKMVGVDNYLLTLFCSSPIILQPSEIKKVPTSLVIEIEDGYVLNITSSPFLYNQAINIFPSPFIIDSSHEGEILLPLQNCGRNQVNVAAGQVLGKGYLTRMEQAEIEKFDYNKKQAASLPKTKPQKKNTDIQFEIR